MPPPASKRGQPITSAPFESPFESPVFPYGVGGLDLASPLDRIAVGRFSRLTNVHLQPNAPGGLTTRPGLTALVTGAGNFHTISRFADPEAAASTYLWGVGTTLARGNAGAVTVIDTGYSGDPMTFLQYHPPLSGDPWMYVGDSAKMRKIRFDGLDLPIALATPTIAATTIAGTQQTTPIAAFAASDGSQASAWTASTPITPGLVAPTVTDSTQNGVTPAVKFHLVVNSVAGSATNPDIYTYYGLFGLAKTLNLSLVGATVAEDADAIQLLIALKAPVTAPVTEVRVYLVCSPVFTPTYLPGQSAQSLGNVPIPDNPPNADFFVKTFRPDDFAGFLGPDASGTGGAETARLHSVEIDALDQAARRRGFLDVVDHEVQRVDPSFLQTQDPTRAATLQASGAAAQSTAFGTIGIPLRRGDFRRYGSTPGTGWDTITGIIVYLGTSIPAATQRLDVQISAFLSLMTLVGGSGPDTMDAATQSYDYRYTHYDPRSGDESNPSPEMADADFLDVLRTAVLATPTAYGDAAIRQRFYRRGGILTNDWYFVGSNASDGGVFTDAESDLEIAAAGTLALDNYEPVPTVDDAGTTILAQPVPVLLGPVNGQLFALGDPHRPGTVYSSKSGEPDHWPPDQRCEVCAPGEQLLNGVLYGGQILLFSRDAAYFLYPNLLGNQGMTASPAGCTRGLAGRWALTTGAGAVYGVATDGVFVTTGGPEEIISDDISPLFRGQTVNGYAPINLAIENNLRLCFFQRELYFQYEDTTNFQRCLVYSPETKQWRSYVFSENLVSAYADEVANVLIIGLANRAATHAGFSDLGTAIAPVIRTGSWDWGRPREEKLFGDQFLDLDGQGVEITLQNFVNVETITNAAQTLTAAAGRTRAIFDSFGDIPQKGRNLAVEISWSSAVAAPTLYQLGTAITPQPDITINRVTNWDDLGHPDEAYVMGITLDANTSGEDRTVIVERDFNGVISTITTLTVNHDGRCKDKYSWPALPAHQVRLRPDNSCGAWMLFRADWIAKAEPPRIAIWDTTFENAWDQYLTGLDIYCDTENQLKEIVVSVDGVTINNPATGLGFFPVQANGRQVVHLTLPTIPPLRGHVLRFAAQDAFPGLLYDYRWQTVPEPSEQTNWNQPFTILGTQSDKFVKAIIFEVDTFGQNKSVVVEADGVVVDTIIVNTAGRLVRQIAIPQQLGRVWRFLPTDGFPSRLYSLRLVFDEEPFALTRWETQEMDHQQEGFHSLVAAMITLKSVADVTLRISTYVNQLGTIVTDDYLIPATAGVKLKRQVQFVARKGVLYKYLLTSAASFWLYREESQITLQPWHGGGAAIKQPFGNDDITPPTRSMINASIAASRDGGGSQ